MKSTKRLLAAALAFVCLFGMTTLCSAQTGYTLVSATHMEDATGTVIANATIKFQPVNNAGVPIAFHAGGDGGQAIASPVSALITEGAFTIQLADTTLTSPLNVCYSVTIISNVTGQQLPFPGYSCIQPSGATWSLDTYVPNLAALLAVGSGGSATTFSALTGTAAPAQLPAATPTDQGAVTLPSGATTNVLGAAAMLPGSVSVNGTTCPLGGNCTISGGGSSSSGAPVTNPSGGANNYAPMANPSFTGSSTFSGALSVTGGAQGITTPSLTLTNTASGTSGNLFSYSFDTTGVTGLTAVGSPALTTSNSFTQPDSVNFPSGENYYEGALSATSSTIYTRQYVDILTEGTTTNAIMELWYNGDQEFVLYLNSNNTLGWSNPITGNTGSVSATALTIGSYNYIEVYWTANASTGNFIVKVNGTVAYTSAAQNTGSAGANTIYFGNVSASSSGWNINMDDVDVGNTGWIGAASSVTTTEMVMSSTAPNITSGFGSGSTILDANGPAAFSLQVGTSPATSGVLTLPTATHQWNCFCTDTTNPTSTFSCRQSAPFAATSATIVGVNTSTGAAADFTAGDALSFSCFAY